MAVESTPERSFSLLFRSSRAATATTGCEPCVAEMRRRHHGAQCRLDRPASDRTGSWRRRRASCPPRRRGHAGSRRPAANGWSSPNGCAVRARLRDRPACRRCSGRRAPPSRRGGPRAADCRRALAALVGSNSSTRPNLRAPAGRQRPVLALDVVDDRRARPGQQRRHDEADAFAGAGRREAQHMLRTVVAEIVVAPAAEHDAVGPSSPASRTSAVSAQRAEP